jgi:nucleotide-binding universal stress UspA family protein
MAVRARSILVGYDGSEVAQRALDAAAELAGYGSTLAVVSVARGPEDERIEYADGSDPGGHSRSLLHEARERLIRRHVTARYLEPVGEAAEMLVETARELDVDLIVVGRRNQSALQRLVLGSVSAKVVRRAACDVLVVR